MAKFKEESFLELQSKHNNLLDYRKSLLDQITYQRTQYDQLLIEKKEELEKKKQEDKMNEDMLENITSNPNTILKYNQHPWRVMATKNPSLIPKWNGNLEISKFSSLNK